jgi:hypothetical protein
MAPLKRLPPRLALLVLAGSLAACSQAPATTNGFQPTLEWIRQFAGGELPFANAVALDTAGHAFVAGTAIARYNAQGAPIYTVILDQNTPAQDIAVDGQANAYVVTRHFSTRSAQLMRYDAFGSAMWEEHLHFANSGGGQIQLDAIARQANGDLVVVGAWLEPQAEGSDTRRYLATFNPFGTLLWEKIEPVEGFRQAQGHGVTVGSDGSIYVGGRLTNTIPPRDQAFVARYDAGGNQAWEDRFESPAGPTFVWDLAAGGPAQHVCGVGQAAFGLEGQHYGSTDAFVRCYEAAGGHLWTRVLGTTAWDSAHGVAMDPAGQVIVVGHTNGSLGSPLPGVPGGGGGSDGFLAVFSPTGSQMALFQHGTGANDWARGVAADGNGTVVVAGSSQGSMVPGASPGIVLMRTRGF